VVLFVGIYSYDIYERMGGMVPLNDHSAMHAGHQAEGGLGGMGGMAAMADGSVIAASVQSPAGAGQGPEPRVWGGIGPTGAENDALPVDLTAMQFAFIFHYPQGDITSGELHIPAGRPVELRMKANDVIHAFWVPQFRLKQDVIPGQPTVLTFTATRPGSYPIVCAELCGPYHGGMRSTVVVHETDDFNAWLSKNSPATVAAASSGTPTG
jgi:cytochrome c oxidase subunit 2